MAFAPDDATYLLASATGALPNSRTLTSNPITSNLQFNDSGPGGAFTLTPTLNLLSITQVNTNGFLTYTGSNTFVERSFASDGSITITNPSGTGGNPLFSVVDNTSVQQVNVTNGVTNAVRPTINLIAGNNVTISVVDNGGLDRSDVTINSFASGAGTGTVTSVGLTSPSGTLSISGSPITTAGTISVDLVSPVSIIDGGTGQTSAVQAFDALSPMTTSGSMIYGGVSGTGTELFAGIDGQAITQTGGLPGWGSVGISGGGTGQSTQTAGFNALSPMTTVGDIIIGGASGSGTRLGIGTESQVLTVTGGSPSWESTSAAVTGPIAFQLDVNGEATIVYPGIKFTSVVAIYLGYGNGTTATSSISPVPIGVICNGGSFIITAYVTNQPNAAFVQGYYQILQL